MIQKKNSKKDNVLVMLLMSIFLLSLCALTIFGFAQLTRGLFTEYKATTFDLLSLTGGFLSLGFITIISMINDLKKGLKSLEDKLSEKQTSSTPPTTPPDISNIMSKLFSGNKDGNPGFSGSVKIINLNNPDEPIFNGEFDDMKDFQNIKKEIVDKFLKSQGEFHGKKMTKEEVIKKMSVDELKQEEQTAIQNEDYVWAAALRDEIKKR